MFDYNLLCRFLSQLSLRVDVWFSLESCLLSIDYGVDNYVKAWIFLFFTGFIISIISSSVLSSNVIYGIHLLVVMVRGSLAYVVVLPSSLVILCITEFYFWYLFIVCLLLRLYSLKANKFKSVH